MNDAKHQHFSSRELIYTELELENCVRQTVFLYKPHLSYPMLKQPVVSLFIFQSNALALIFVTQSCVSCKT